MGRDRHSARLFGAWLTTSLKLTDMPFEVSDGSPNAVDSVSMSNDAEEIDARPPRRHVVVEGRARVIGREASRWCRLEIRTF